MYIFWHGENELRTGTSERNILVEKKILKLDSDFYGDEKWKGFSSCRFDFLNYQLFWDEKTRRGSKIYRLWIPPGLAKVKICICEVFAKVFSIVGTLEEAGFIRAKCTLCWVKCGTCKY